MNRWGAVAPHNAVCVDIIVDFSPRPSGITVAEESRMESGRFVLLASVGMTKQRSWADAARAMVGPMIQRVNIPYFALVFLFILCQVIGTTCALSDLPVAAGAAPFLEEGMACPMEGAVMCPPSLTSSPERQIKNGTVSDVDHAPILLSFSTALTSPPVSAPWSGSSVLSLVPISISSSSALRI